MAATTTYTQFNKDNFWSDIQIIAYAKISSEDGHLYTLPLCLNGTKLSTTSIDSHSRDLEKDTTGGFWTTVRKIAYKVETSSGYHHDQKEVMEYLNQMDTALESCVPIWLSSEETELLRKASDSLIALADNNAFIEEESKSDTTLDASADTKEDALKYKLIAAHIEKIITSRENPIAKPFAISGKSAFTSPQKDALAAKKK